MELSHTSEEKEFKAPEYDHRKIVDLLENYVDAHVTDTSEVNV